MFLIDGLDPENLVHSGPEYLELMIYWIKYPVQILPNKAFLNSGQAGSLFESIIRIHPVAYFNNNKRSIWEQSGS